MLVSSWWVYFSYYGSHWSSSSAWLPIFFKTSCFVFTRRKKSIQGWVNEDRNFILNYPFKSLFTDNPFLQWAVNQRTVSVGLSRRPNGQRNIDETHASFCSEHYVEVTLKKIRTNTPSVLVKNHICNSNCFTTNSAHPFLKQLQKRKEKASFFTGELVWVSRWCTVLMSVCLRDIFSLSWAWL